MEPIPALFFPASPLPSYTLPPIPPSMLSSPSHLPGTVITLGIHQCCSVTYQHDVPVHITASAMPTPSHTDQCMQSTQSTASPAQHEAMCSTQDVCGHDSLPLTPILVQMTNSYGDGMS